MGNLRRHSNSWPKIFGAGPGNPEYLTLKLVKELATAKKKLLQLKEYLE